MLDLQPTVSAVAGPVSHFEPLPEFLKVEQARNIAATKTFHRFLHRAVGKCEIMVAHHISFDPNGEGSPNEIPSADSLLFNPLLMGRVFGDKAEMVMVLLAKRPIELREKVLAEYLDSLDAEDPEGAL